MPVPRVPGSIQFISNQIIGDSSKLSNNSEMDTGNTIPIAPSLEIISLSELDTAHPPGSPEDGRTGPDRNGVQHVESDRRQAGNGNLLPCRAGARTSRAPA